MERFANVATVIGSFVALIAFLVGVCQFTQTQELARENLANEREVKAVELFMKFNEIQEKVSATGKPMSDVDYWRGNNLVAISESIYNLTGNSPNWSATVKWMLDVLTPFLIGSKPDCNTYSPGFAALLKARSEALCAE